jgi:multidrug efflux pump subunit AcrB
MFSAVVALTLTPALCIMLMKPHQESHGPLARFFKGFNAGFERLNARYGVVAATLARRTLMVMLTLAIIIGVTGGLFRSVPSGFVPDEDKGAVFMQVVLPDAASQERTEAVLRQVEPLVRAVPGVDSIVSVTGYDLISGTAASNGALVIVKLKPWAERTAPEQHASEIVKRLWFATKDIPEALVMPFNPPALPGFGSVSGFSFMLQARSNQSLRNCRGWRRISSRPRSSDPRSGASRRPSAPARPTINWRSTGRKPRSSACPSAMCSRHCRRSLVATRSTTSAASGATTRSRCRLNPTSGKR